MRSRGLALELTLLGLALLAIFALGRMLSFLASIQMRIFAGLLILLGIVALILWLRFRSLRRNRRRR